MPRELIEPHKGDKRYVRRGERTHFDAVTVESSAPSGRPAELRPAKAIANIPIAKIEPRTAFALSHPSNSRGFLR
jgi:hypothetical protein